MLALVGSVRGRHVHRRPAQAGLDDDRQARERPGVPRHARQAARRRDNSYAKRLRRDLFRAGVHRVPPVRVPATSPGTRTDLGKRAKGPVDFHSFRRAFSTALAEAGVNAQHATHVAAHADLKTHMRYVMQTAAMRAIPVEALPSLPAQTAGIVTARDDSTSKPARAVA